MTPEQLRSKISTENWSEEFVDAAIELAGQGEDTDENIYQLREDDEFTRTDDNSLVRIVYCYQRLLDEDNVPGIYCTIYSSQYT
jgi:septation ring formation regulator EzrA